MEDDLAALIAEMKDAPIRTLAKSQEEGSPHSDGGESRKRKSKGDLSISLKKKKSKKSGQTELPSAQSTGLLDVKPVEIGDKFIWNHFVVLSPEQDSEILRWSSVNQAATEPGSLHGVTEARRLAVEETMRWRAMSRLANTFHDTCGNALGAKWTRHFEKWLYSRRAVCVTCPAGVFPIGKGVETDEELSRKLTATGMKATQAERLCEIVGTASKKAAHSIGRVAVSAGKKNSKVKVQRLSLKEGDRQRDKMVLSCSGVNMEVNADHFTKLQALFARSNQPDPSPDSPALHAAVFALLARYASFQGGHYKAGGFQAAIHGECFDVLHTDFGCWLECFASPLNCRYARFCSAHPRTDAPFGSLGSFFDFNPRCGSFEANPPFDDGTMLRMLAHMERLLARTSLPLAFVVIVPYLPSQAAWMALNASRYNKKRLHLPQAEHGYFEGSQHDRINRYRVAPFDTSVFFLRNAAGHERWPLAPEKLQRLVRAFRPKVHLNPHGLQFAPDHSDDDEEGAEETKGKSGPDHDEVAASANKQRPHSPERQPTVPKHGGKKAR